jgi:SAM-dependent methyltransferase
MAAESSLDHAICDYEGTSYRARFWDGQGREYEDLAERIALRGLLPPSGSRLVEIGAGFGRLAELYAGYEQVVLVDYAVSGLREAQERLGASERFVYVAADLYRLPLASGTCDTAVTVRVLHHLEDVPAALRGIAAVLRPGGTYVLEYANKRNLKSIARYLLHQQSWSPFAPEPYEFVRLNFDFHPDWMVQELKRAGFGVDAGKAVSHFRYPLIKRVVPARVLAVADGALQGVGAAWKLSPSIFMRAHIAGAGPISDGGLFCCPACRSLDLKQDDEALACEGCGAAWSKIDGIYDFRSPRGVDPEPPGAS